MAYIYLDELKEILPSILDQWIDKDDESWEWIFNEIGQKCYIGTRLTRPDEDHFTIKNGKKSKGKKKWKKYVEDDIHELKSITTLVDTHTTVLSTHRIDINVLTKRVDELNNHISNLSDKYTSMVTKVNNINRDVNVAKSMAETAKQRTEVDYTKYKQPISYGLWSDCERVIATCERYGATKEELEQLDLIMSKYIRNPAVVDGNPEIKVDYIKDEHKKTCETCIHGTFEESDVCDHLCKHRNKWEAKDE